MNYIGSFFKVSEPENQKDSSNQTNDGGIVGKIFYGLLVAIPIILLVIQQSEFEKTLARMERKQEYYGSRSKKCRCGCGRYDSCLYASDD